MTLSSAYFLVAHGSRNAEYQQSLDSLAALVSEELRAEVGEVAIATGCLELAPLPLHQAICQFAQKVAVLGLKRVKIYPLFLLAGVHVTQDIPTEVNLAQKFLGNEVTLELLPHLGVQPSLVNLLQRKFEAMAAPARVLLSHGTRLDRGNRETEKIASQLRAIPAYWSISPNLKEQVEFLVSQGESAVAIVPFFLFAKGIAEIIAQQIQQLQQENANLRLLWSDTLGATQELARVIIEGM